MKKSKQSLRSITFTSGQIRNLSSVYKKVNTRGSVRFCQEIHVTELSTHGYSSFNYHVIADRLSSSGVCNIKNNCEIGKLTSAGTTRLTKGRIKEVNSTGQLTIQHSLQADKMNLLGKVTAMKINTKAFHLTLSGKSQIEQLHANTIEVQSEKKTLSLQKKQLLCKSITGNNITLSHTSAKNVEGDVVTIGEKCVIEKLIFKESYTISRHSTVKQIMKGSD